MTARSLANEIATLKLFSLPDVVLRLNELLQSPYATNAEIGEVLMSDPALSARTLKLANSALYALSSKVETMSKAVILLGRNAIRNLAFTTYVTHAFKGIPSEWVDMDRFWLNSLACGVIARSLAFRCKLFDNEHLFMAGLLHKVGRLMFYCSRPEEYREVLLVKDRGEAEMLRAEERVFGFTHAELGAELLRLWKLPERLCTVVAHYPAPLASMEHRHEVAIVHVASVLAYCIEPGVDIPQDIDPESIAFDHETWDVLNLSKEIIPTVIQDAWVQTFEILEIIKPNLTLIY
ncbi:MAG TPA: HDOD domain-containing protein [Methylococcaceae bacterium]|nr:HDOD domain-containing protein [Methylococcaceae bacterium]